MRFGLKACQNLAVFLCCPSQPSVLNEKIYISGVVPPLLTPPVTDRLINYQKSVCGFLAVVSVYRRCPVEQAHAAPPGDGSWKRRAAFINVWQHAQGTQPVQGRCTVRGVPGQVRSWCWGWCWAGPGQVRGVWDVGVGAGLVSGWCRVGVGLVQGWCAPVPEPVRPWTRMNLSAVS